MMKLLFFIQFLILWKESIGSYQNDWDGILDMECPSGQHIYGVKSIYDGGRKDRRYQFFCRPGFATTDCSWSNWLNYYDASINILCHKNDGILTGMYSQHDNGREDRRWKIKCCRRQNYDDRRCTDGYWTSYTPGSWHEPVFMEIPEGYGIIGFNSFHENSQEDRKMKFKVCKFPMCYAHKMTILDNIRPTSLGKQVIGVATKQACASGTATVALGQTTSVTDSRSITSTKGGTFEYSTTISVEAEVEVGFLGTGGKATFGLAQSFGGSKEWANSDTHGTSTGYESTQSSEITFEGPGAALIIGTVEKFRFNYHNVNVRYDIRCSDGSTRTENHRVSLTGTTFGKSHYSMHYGKFNHGRCNTQTEQCVHAVRANTALNSGQIYQSFAQCFSGKGTVSK